VDQSWEQNLSRTDSKARPVEAAEQNNNLININTASKAALDQLWGIGPATAEKIIDYRQNNGGFTQIEEIKNIDGIDDGKFNRWQDKISVK
jgi:competence protein ComEC